MYQRVVVTVKRKDEARVRDLEVPVNLTAERLAEMIARALRWETDMAGQRITYLIEAHPLGRMLQPDETLAGAGVWDGSWLVLHPMQLTSQGGEVAVPTVESPIPASQKQAPPVTAQPQATQSAVPPIPIPIPTPVSAPEEEPWTFPATPGQPAAPEPVVSQPEQADSSALLEMLLGGGGAPAPGEEQPSVPAQPVPPVPAPVEETPPPVPGFQAAEQPAAPGPETWTFPMVTAPLPPEPQSQAPSTAGDIAAQQEAQPAESNSILEMLLGGAPSGPPTTPAPESLPEALAPSWPYPAEPEPQPAGTKDDIWTFPVASSAEVQAVQPPPVEEEEEEETQPAPAPSPFDAWAFPVAPEQPAETAPGQPTYTPEPAPAQADGGSLLEMLLGGEPAAPTEGAAQPQPAPVTPPVFEGQPPVVTPPEPQPDTSQAAASAQPQQPEKDKGKPLTEPKVGGFRPLGIELPPETEPPPDEKKPRFVWKKLDE